MKRLLFAMLIMLPGCSTITNNFTGDHNVLHIEQPKTVTTSPSASGNTVPVLP